MERKKAQKTLNLIQWPMATFNYTHRIELWERGEEGRRKTFEAIMVEDFINLTVTKLRDPRCLWIPRRIQPQKLTLRPIISPWLRISNNNNTSKEDNQKNNCEKYYRLLIKKCKHRMAFFNASSKIILTTQSFKSIGKYPS